MNALLAALLTGLAAWLVSLAYPRWTRRLLGTLRRRWRLLAAPALGVAVVVLADPYVLAALSTTLWQFWSAPGLAVRAALLLLLVAPLLAAARLAPGGARTLLLCTVAGIRWVATWLPLPLAAASLAAHRYAAAWSHVLGGNLASPAAVAARFLLGAAAMPGTAATVDAALVPAVDAMILSVLLAVCAQRLATTALQRRPGKTLSRLTVADVSACLRSPAITILCLLGILLLAFHARWLFLVDSLPQGNGLSADGRGYFDEALALDQLAQQRQVNYLALFFQGSTYSREPVYIYLLRGWLALTGAEPLHAQYFSLAASLVWLAVAVPAVWSLLGRWPALLTGLLLAVDDTWIRNAVTGLREEVTGVFLVAAVALLFSRHARAAGLSWLAPVCAALASLTRLDALPSTLFVVAWAALALRWRWRRALVMSLLCASILAPALGGYARARGTPIPAATVISTNNWLDEFQDRIGTPGFERDRQVTAFEYLFHYHTPAQVALYTARGAGIIYGQQIFDPLYYRLAGWSAATGGWGRVLGLSWRPLVPLVFALGCLFLLAQPRRWRTHWLPVALCAVGVLPPIGFSAGVPGHMMYQARYGYLVAPFAFAIVAWAVCAAVSFAWQRAFRSMPALFTSNARIPSPAAQFASPPLITHHSSLITAKDPS